MSSEIENLRFRKEALISELQSEEQKEKSLQEEIAILENKIEIRDIEKKLETRRESIRQLVTRKTELQNKWDQSDTSRKTDEEPKESTPEVVVNVEPAYSPEPEPIPVEETTGQKKHRFF